MQEAGRSPDTLTQPVTETRKRPSGCLKISFVLVFIPVLVLLAGFGYQSIASALDARHYPPPGRFVEVDGHKIHINCTGDPVPGLPTVILIASHPATSSSWVWIQPEVSLVTRTCSYDRTGTGWSDSVSSEPTMAQMAGELHALLDRAGEPAPYLLVGHSWGGGISRIYAAAYPEQVSGMVWIEATHPDAWARRGLPPSTFSGIPPKMVEGIPFATRAGIFRLFPNLRGGWGVVPELPDRQQAELGAYFNTNKWADYVVAVERALPDSLEQLRQSGNIGDKPLAIILGSASEEEDTVGAELQTELAELSTAHTVLKIDGANHSTLVHEQRYAAEVSEVIIQMANSVR